MDDWKKKLRKLKKDLPLINIKPKEKGTCRPSLKETRVSKTIIRRRKRS